MHRLACRRSYEIDAWASRALSSRLSRKCRVIPSNPEHMAENMRPRGGLTVQGRLGRDHARRLDRRVVRTGRRPGARRGHVAGSSSGVWLDRGDADRGRLDARHAGQSAAETA